MEVVLLSLPIIELMLTDARFASFDCIKTPAKLPAQPRHATAGCGGCGKKPKIQAAQPEQLDYNGIKLCIASATPEVKRQIRDALECDLVVMQFKAHDGSVQKDEF